MLIPSEYQSPFPFNNGHVETLVPYFLGPSLDVPFQRERIFTDDDDFLDLDWYRANHDRLVILSHGLEGCSQSKYILSHSQALSQKGYDILAWNNRGCSGETNHNLKMYHSGASFDLRTVIKHVLIRHTYKEINLVGFSMGGNITLKYLGEEGDQLDPRICRAVAISTPVSLADSAMALSSGLSLAYSRHFILRLIKKLKIKEEMFPEFDPDIPSLKKMWRFKAFDDKITAPINGFKDADEYWDKASSLHFLETIPVPTLVLNALNDPFLKDRCYPFDVLKEHPNVYLEPPQSGGHVGFLKAGLNESWMEERVLQFLQMK